MLDLTQLRRFPDVEAPNLLAADATDRLLLATAEPELRDCGPGEVVMVGDRYGALTLAAIANLGCRQVRVHQDALTGVRAIDANATRLGVVADYRHLPLSAELFDGARLVLIQAPKSIDALAEIVSLIAEHAEDRVTVHLGGRVKYLTHAMNDVLARPFSSVQAGLARQKSRVITARDRVSRAPLADFPAREWHADQALWVCAHGGAFAGTKIDLGTRRLIQVLPQLPAADAAIDLGCGTGVLSVLLARRGVRVLATDQSAAAVASARATVQANDVAGLVSVEQDDALSTVPDASAELIVCNPPFHVGGAVHAGAAVKLFQAAGRVLRPGGQLWTVYNSHLGYAGVLADLVGPTTLVHRDQKFTVSASTRR